VHANAVQVDFAFARRRNAVFTGEDTMPLAYWCVLVAALLPLFWAGYAKAGGEVDNHYPRESADDLPPKPRRAYAAHHNAYENFPFFAAAVIIAVTQGATISTVNALAVVYVALRVVHGVLYVANQSTARSAVYGLALLANIAIFVLPAFK
jgi:uncharacterized MAPEG superfamily protein